MAQKLLLTILLISLAVESLTLPYIQRRRREIDIADDIDLQKPGIQEAEDVEEGQEDQESADPEADPAADPAADPEVDPEAPDSNVDIDLQKPGIQLASLQDSSNSQDLGSAEGAQGGAAGAQQIQQGQQQIVASVGGKHYVLQQQGQLGQQLARLGKKTAVNQLADSQSQAIADTNNDESDEGSVSESADNQNTVNQNQNTDVVNGENTDNEKTDSEDTELKSSAADTEDPEIKNPAETGSEE